MFTIKLYASGRQKIVEAESFTILRNSCVAPDDGSAEITLHQKNPGDDIRYDINGDPAEMGYAGPERFTKAIIENSAGKTTEIIGLRPIGSPANK